MASTKESAGTTSDSNTERVGDEVVNVVQDEAAVAGVQRFFTIPDDVNGVGQIVTL